MNAYPDADIERLRLAKQMKPLGFSLEEMRDMLDLRSETTTARPRR